ncbi:hypothetical protein L3X38_031713 [Prunus dulcis]|uniref:Reverse transcriptase domain-containing protein n=1 Tax=Prunus dulcis TaxID=3755 RepID=A0AAD4YV87_PRUDU|nr:hypothetical protein L3X38_031713 [Prunus dulcis]
MNVPPQRRPKNMSKEMGNQGSGSMNQSSRFDVLRKVSEDFGFDNVDSGGMAAQGTAGKSFVYKNGAGFEKKIWTKTRQTNIGNKVMLGDISSKHGNSKASGLFGGKTTVGLSGLSKSSVSAKGKKVVDERRASVFEYDLPNLFPSIAAVDLANLVRSIDFLEVKENLFHIGGLKAPGVDGFLVYFFQIQWDLCANDIYSMVCQAFVSCNIPDGLNSTLITLVPKVDNPSSMVHFRPISLCCTLYKVISKVLVARLRPIMPGLISPNQVSFVPGRHIFDSILIAQELMHKFRNAKRKKGFIAWKIDLSKAYDRLNWRFIEFVIKEVGLPPSIVQLIMHYVSSVKYQGDEGLPRVVLYCSGQTVNFDKSAVLCSPNTCKEVAKEISLRCGFPLAENLGKYLGMPLLHSRITKATYGGLVDKVHGRLASWKARSFSQGGVEVVSEGHSLWAKIFEAKYLKGQSILDSKLASRQGSSSTWKGVLFGAELLNKGLIWRLGKGDRVNFWKDTWIGDFPLMQRVDSIEGVDVDCPISHFFKHGW